jgi:hypothetical protein
MIKNIILGMFVGVLSGLYMGFAVGVTYEPVQVVFKGKCPSVQAAALEEYRAVMAELD